MLFRIKVSLITGVAKQLYPLVLSHSDHKTVMFLGTHKTVYRHMFLWLETVLGLGVLQGTLRNWNRRILWNML